MERKKSMPDQSPEERVEPALLRAEQAAAYLNISVRNLWRLSAHGHLKPVYLGRSVRFAIRDLDRFIEQGGTPVTT